MFFDLPLAPYKLKSVNRRHALTDCREGGSIYVAWEWSIANAIVDRGLLAELVQRLIHGHLPMAQEMSDNSPLIHERSTSVAFFNLSSLNVEIKQWRKFL